MYYTTYERTDMIPFNKNGYVITPDGKIHSLRYKFSHNLVIAKLYPNELKTYGYDFEPDLDNCQEIYGFANKMPVITLSFLSDSYSVYHNTGITNEQYNSVEHLLKYVYGLDSDEKVQFSNYVGTNTVRKLLEKFQKNMILN